MDDLRAVYDGYLSALNDRRWDDLERFVHAEIVRNGRAILREEFVAIAQRNVAAIPDFSWTLRDLVTVGERVAVRLEVGGTPSRDVSGLPVTGRSFHVAEMAMYRFRDGRFAELWVTFDRAAAVEQLRASTADGGTRDDETEGKGDA